MNIRKATLLLLAFLGITGIINHALAQACPSRGFMEITSTTTSACPGQSVTFSISFFSPPGTPDYMFSWYLNGSHIADGTTYTTSSLTNGAQISCQMFVSVSGCATVATPSNTITMTVGSLGVPTDPSSGITTICTGSSNSYFTSATAATSYTWSIYPLSAGSITVSSIGSCEVNWAPGFTGPATVNVTASGCGTTSAASSTAVNIIPNVSLPAAPAGSSPICQNASANYSTSASYATSYNWTLNGAAIAGSGSSNLISMPAGLSGPATIGVSANGCGGPTAAMTKPITITPSVGIADAPIGSTTICQASAPLTYTTTNIPNNTGFTWSINPGAGSISGTGNTATVTWNPSFVGSASIGVLANGCNASVGYTFLDIRVNPTTSSPTIPAGPAANNSAEGTEIYTTTAANATGYTWSLSPVQAGTISGSGASASVDWDSHYTGSAAVSVTVTGCLLTTPTATKTVGVYPSLIGGVLSPAAMTIAPGSSPGLLTATPATGGNCSGSYAYLWQQSSDGINFTGTGVITPNYTAGILGSTTYFRRQVSCGSDVVYTNVSVITASSATVDMNYIRTRTITRPGITDLGAANGLTDLNDVKQTTQYFDGLGRSVQTVTQQMSPLGKDMVAPQVYDPFGRQSIQYQPYISTSSDGNYKPNALQEQSIFNSSQFPGEQYYYGETTLEPSPLSRPLMSYAPGLSWVGTGTGIASDYLINDGTDSVQIWNIDLVAGSLPVSAGTYAEGLLFKNVSTDEQGHKLIEYKDKEGHSILKKAQISDVPAPGHSGWLCTYYVYDIEGDLRFVIQPKAIEWLASNGWNFAAAGGSDVADELCFRYEYDYRNRMIIKKVPGAGEVWTIYDIRDRPVFTQDANQRPQDQWLSTQYDGLNRVVMIGLMTYTATQESLQQTVTTQTAAGGIVLSLPSTLVLNTVDKKGLFRATQQIILDDGFSSLTNGEFTAMITDANGYEPGYGTGSFAVNDNPVPTAATVQPLIINYYDNYDWVAGTGSGLGTALATEHTTDGNYFITSYNTSPAYATPVTDFPVTRGQSTGNMRLILGENRPLFTVNFYDDRVRMIQARSMNHTSGVDTLISQYDFSGKLLRTLLTHYKAGHTAQYHKVLTKMNYDAGFRLKSIWKNIDGAASDQLIDSMQYNELGQLSDKYLGSGLDNLVYDYNIRGWLTGINKDFVSGTATHYFGMDLGYDKATNAAGTTYVKPLFNGNISGTIWKSAGDNVSRKYDFTYDNVNRLMGAAYLDNYNGGWDHTTMDYTVGNLDYDANGNILKMSQNGFKVGSPVGPVDQLAYAYQANSNKLAQVNDDANDSLSLLGDFHYKGVKQAYDYSYDPNGNLLQDNNKAIDHITYNFLNLPQQVHVNGKGNITYTYDAGGNKLQKVTTDSMSRHSTTTLYLGGFVYQQTDTITNPGGGVDTLQFTGQEEGRVRWAPHHYLNGDSAISWEYDFYEKDHLGNTRILLTQERDTVQYMATMEAAYRSKEVALFYNVDSTSFPSTSVPGGYPSDVTTIPNDSVARVNGSGHKMGPALLLKVMSGDSVVFGVKSFYRSGGTVGAPNNSMQDVLNSLAGGLVAITSGTHGVLSDLNGSGSPVYAALNSFLTGNDPNTSGTPKAYLNWMLLDNQFNYVTGNTQSGAIPVGSPDVLNTLANSVGIHKSGFLYIWVSNETRGWDVFFDNLSVETFSGPLLEENHYYPFGLTMAGISDKALKSNYAENKYRFVGQLYSDDLGWDTYEFKFRTQDPQLGRFWQVDPLATKYVYNSTYAYAENRVINGIDLEGAEYFFPNASGVTAIAHAVNPKTITAEAVKATQEADLKANQINAKVAPVIGIGIIGIADPAVGIPLALTWLTGVPVTPSPQAIAGATIEEGTSSMVKTEASANVTSSSSADPLYHYAPEQYANSISNTGLNTSSDGFTYTTTNGNLTPVQAQIDLALSPNRGLPNALFKIDAKGLSQSGINPVFGPKLVTGGNSGAGGGTEVLFNKKIPPQFINRIK